MKKRFVLPCLILLLVWGCRNETIRIYKGNSPVTISYDEWRSIEPKLQDSIGLENPGKIYAYKNALYINETGKGIHVYDNSDPLSPVDMGFIDIHCNFDVAVKGNTLYAGSYSDLLIFDVSDPLEPIYFGRETDVFNLEYTNVTEGFDASYPVKYVNMSEEVVLRWELKTVEEKVEDSNNGIFSILEDFAFAAKTDIAYYGGSGTGGSMASFTVMNNTLYILDQTNLKYTSLADEKNLPEFEEIWLFRDAETLFPHQNNLFIGTTTGMLIYSISNNGTPTYLSSFDHWTGCDPVVVSDNIAYVTLSSGCGLQRNELHVVDVSNLSNPELIKTYDFEHPLGLGIDDSTLFLCDDYAGLKVFDIKSPDSIKNNMIHHYSDINAYDVIPLNDILIVVGTDGVFQYDYSNPSAMVLLSQIKPE